MADLGDFNAEEVEPSGDFAPIPEGVYRVMITESEVRETSAGTGHFLSLRLVLTGNEQYDGRVLFVNLNLDNPNKQTVRIAKSDLSAICHAVGIMKPGDSTKLHDIPFYVRVGVDKRKDTGSLVNRVKAYLKLEDAPEQGTADGAKQGKADWMQK